MLTNTSLNIYDFLPARSVQMQGTDTASGFRPPSSWFPPTPHFIKLASGNNKKKAIKI